MKRTAKGSGLRESRCGRCADVRGEAEDLVGTEFACEACNGDPETMGPSKIIE